MNIGNYEFDLRNNPIIMGILNVTPDSFSDGGKFNSIDKALKRTRQMIDEGAEIIDVGGESTRPGYTLISDEEEIERVVPIIEAIKQRFDIAVSLDTYKTNVAEAGISAGCDMINDIWGFKYGKKDMAQLAARTGVTSCIMHNKENAVYDDFIADVVKELRESIVIAHGAGVKDSQIIIDPGVGFAKSFQQNLEIIRNVDKLQELGYPILLGTSRKSVIGIALDADKADRLSGTVATTVMGLERGCRIFRVHDVKANYQAMMMAEKIMRA